MYVHTEWTFFFKPKQIALKLMYLCCVKTEWNFIEFQNNLHTPTNSGGSPCIRIDGDNLKSALLMTKNHR